LGDKPPREKTPKETIGFRRTKDLLKGDPLGKGKKKTLGASNKGEKTPPTPREKLGL